MGFGEAIQTGFSNWLNLSGRATRSEYWYWSLFVFICVIVTKATNELTGIPIARPTSVIATLLMLAISVRRLHDLDESGWWVLLALLPYGKIILIVWFWLRGTVGPNRFGDDPLAGVFSARPAT